MCLCCWGCMYRGNESCARIIWLLIVLFVFWLYASLNSCNGFGSPRYNFRVSMLFSFCLWSKIYLVWRMIPHKTKRGEAALARLKVFEGVPPPYDKTKRMVIPDALKWVFLEGIYARNMFCLVNAVECLFFLCFWWIRVLRLQPGHKYCLLGQLSSEVGWNHYDTIKVWIVYPVSSFFTFAASLWCYYLWPSYLDFTFFRNSLNCI